jgi:hypothetical protein
VIAVTVARMTKDRITNVLGVLGAIFCLVAVLTGFGHAAERDGDDDDAPAAPPPTSQVAPVPGAPAPQPPAVQAPAQPAQPPADDDGDDDDG